MFLFAPIFFFFELDTSHLINTFQLVNLNELTRVAKKYGLVVKVTGRSIARLEQPVSTTP